MKREVIDAAHLCIAADVPCLLVGSSGVGKSTLMRGLAKKFNLEPVVFNMVLTNSDGIAVERINKDTNRMEIVLAPEPQKAVEKASLIIVEEVTCQAPLGVKTALLELLMHKSIRNIGLHPRSRCVGCCNPLNEATEAEPLGCSLAARFTLIRAETSEDARIEYARRLAEIGDEDLAAVPDDLLPFSWEVTPDRIASEVARLTDRAMSLGIRDSGYSPDKEFEEGIPAPQPCNRSWVRLAKLVVAARPAIHIDRDRAMAALRLAANGTVGETAASVLGDISFYEEARKVIEAVDKPPYNWEALRVLERIDGPSILRDVIGVALEGECQPETLARIMLWCYGNIRRDGLQGVCVDMMYPAEVKMNAHGGNFKIIHKIIDHTASAILELGSYQGSRTSDIGQYCLQRLGKLAQLDDWPPSRKDGRWSNGYHDLPFGKII